VTIKESLAISLCGTKSAEMWTTLLFAGAALLAAVTSPAASNPTYQETGDCEATHEHLYKYTAEEEYFGDENAQTFQITIHLKVYCLSGMSKN
jgi:hypothetical protein